LGWLVPSIPWTLIGRMWAYNIAWMFVLGAVRLTTEPFAAYRTARQAKSVQGGQRAAAAACGSAAGESSMESRGIRVCRGHECN
jgi:hypothetical protein